MHSFDLSSNRASFEQHSATYARRVVNREQNIRLSVDDLIIRELSTELLGSKQGLALLDAGCGTGDRLRMMFERGILRRDQFDLVVGMDFSQSMLSRSADQLVDEATLYDSLSIGDLSTDVDGGLQPKSFDVVFCLWDIVNTSGSLADRLLENLGRLVAADGVLIFDVSTVSAVDYARDTGMLISIERLREANPQTFIRYRRADATTGRMQLFTGLQILDLLEISGLETYELRGHDYNSYAQSRLDFESLTGDSEPLPQSILVAQTRHVGAPQDIGRIAARI
jgi:SAM-dependent methyltransferase